MATMGPQNEVLSEPGAPAVGRGIQNRVAAYPGSGALALAEAALTASSVNIYASDPVATEDDVGRFIIIEAAGLPSIIKVCVKNSAGGYEWVGFGLSS
jgi:hypothetical protein